MEEEDVEGFVKEPEYQLSPRILLTEGTLVKVRGIRGKCSFIAIVTNPAGEQWADVYTKNQGGHRSVAVDRILRRLTH